MLRGFDMLTCSLVILALFASTQGRAVNISNTWVLPEEGFPVFYRYFRDRISWYEADAVCQFHHANLVTVDTTAQYDAVRAYLKELDISSAVWVGLIRSNPDGDFTWTDYRGLSGDGYWSAAPDSRAAPLCAAADPAADYRWEARSCGGPSIASFICELPVPQWALGNEGCMVRALPALTILYLPESAAVQLTADCGLAGVKRVQCTGNVKRETLLKDLSCNDENESSTTLSPAAIGSSWSTSDSTVNSTDWDISETTPEEETTTEHQIDTQPKSTQLPRVKQDKVSNKKSTNKLTNVNIQKEINLDLFHNNNLQSNDIPKLAYSENFLTVEQSEKLEDEKHMHHKMLHDELAKHANYETIFTQPTDHFVPPLVMAKAKISDDMTVLSLAEKHAQQLAEQRLSEHDIPKEPKTHSILSNDEIVSKPSIETLNKVEITDKPLVLTLQTSNTKDSSKKVKSGLPKKYIEKFEDPKVKNFKIDGKLLRFDKTTEKYFTVTDVATKLPDPLPSVTTETSQINSQEESIELTVHLKEPNTLNISTISKLKPDLKNLNDSDSITELDKTSKSVTESDNKIFFSRNDNTTSSVHTKLQNNTEESNLASLSTATADQESIKTTQSPAKIGTEASHEVSMSHEVIKITIVNNDDKANPIHNTFDVTTLVPKFTYKENVDSDISELKTIQHKDNFIASTKVTIPSTVATTHDSTSTTTQIDIITTPVSLYTINNVIDSKNNNTDTSEAPITTKIISDTEIISVLHANESKQTEQGQPTTEALEITNENADTFNISGIFEETDRNVTDQDVIDDFNSPLLSAASEPLHRPNRSRRPKQPTRLNKFNPFRILG